MKENKQIINAGNELMEHIATLTGIKLEVLQGIAKENGVQFILQHPNAIPCTRTQKAKLLNLKGFIQKYGETVFLKEEVTLNSSIKAGEYFVRCFENECSKEYLVAAFLDAQNRIIATKVMFEGTLSEAPIYPREIVKVCIEHDTHSIILAHNHPGGSLRASTPDIECTKKIKTALETVSISTKDHIIVAGNKYVSMAEEGLL
jgi:DNA repair protein RadC